MPATASDPGTVAPPHRLRLRLTLLYGLLSVLSGIGLLLLTYAMFQQADAPAPIGRATAAPDGSVTTVPGDGPELPASGGENRLAVIGRVNQLEPGDLLGLPLLALAIMALISLGVGWVAAGRVLRPVRVMTERIQGISERNVHERLAAAGPRDELTDLADTVDGLLGRLDRALEAQKRFVANAAHELRTPLTVEHALLEEALIDPDATLRSFRENFDRLLAISGQRSRLLESLLTLAASERGLERSEPIDLVAVVQQVLDQRRADLHDRRLVLHLDLRPASVAGDPPLVERLVANLCDNALEHNRPGGRVEVGIARSGARLVLTVANSGRRLPPEQVERLMEPFQRLERTVDRHHHGLGLSIVRAIATAHGATVAVTARPTGGLSVAVAFPLVAPEPPRRVGMASAGGLPAQEGERFQGEDHLHRHPEVGGQLEGQCQAGGVLSPLQVADGLVVHPQGLGQLAP